MGIPYVCLSRRGKRYGMSVGVFKGRVIGAYVGKMSVTVHDWRQIGNHSMNLLIHVHIHVYSVISYIANFQSTTLRQLKYYNLVDIVFGIVYVIIEAQCIVRIVSCNAFMWK